MAWSGFVVRPFGLRRVQAQDGEDYQVDFDHVQRELITPALAAAGILGSTTESLVEAGNIREDMFQLLAHADVVIADISLHNANVFYELGARHALRPRRTFLIRFAGDEVPFDLKTDRYLRYDHRNPAASVAALAAGLQATLNDSGGIDSPIFKLLPALKAPAIQSLVPVPPGFRDELAQASAQRGIGHLVLLGQEADQLPWGAEGLRLVARALRALGANPAALNAWQALRRRLDHDLEADMRLATLLQRLGDLAGSDAAISRALANPDLQPAQRAETLALRASNAKTRWMQAWADTDTDTDTEAQPAQRAARALQSPFLAQACADYSAGFAADLNHFYSGINALMMARIRLDLARAAPQAWADSFDSDALAQRALQDLDLEVSDLMGAVKLSAQRTEATAAPDSTEQRWARFTAADVQLLRNERAGRVRAGYWLALEGAPAEMFDVARRQWRIYQQLGLFDPTLPQLLPLLDKLTPPADEHATGLQAPERLILFSGHRIDEAGRAPPRFPAAAAGAVQQALQASLAALLAQWPAGSVVCGIASGASGGDILFHEACQALGIATALYLPMPADEFVARSVQVAGAPDWVQRFQAIHQRCSEAGLLRQMGNSATLPHWLAPLPGYSVWERCNRWMLQSALRLGSDKMALLALWDGGESDGPGGTAQMVAAARDSGAAWQQIRPLAPGAPG